MAGANLKRSTATETQSRTKKTKTKSPKDAGEHFLRSEQSEMTIEPADGDIDDFEDDPTVWNPIASQLHKAMENVKKPDHWPRDFAKSVKERQRVLLEELKLASQALTAGQQQFTSQFHNVIAAALAPVGTEYVSASQALKITHIAPTGQPLHDKSSILLEESKKLLARYHQLAQPQCEASRFEDIAREFTADKDQTARAIAAGRRVADTEIDDMLADKLHEVRGRNALTADDETLGREILQIGQNQRSEELAELASEGWGAVAYRAQRAVGKLYKVTLMGE